MALSTDQYGYLIDPLVPITDATGTTIKDGFLRVYIAGSSTPVITYRNFDGAVNEKTIELDNSGRCKYPIIVNKSLAYKVVVYDAQHSQETPIITVDKMFATGASITAGAGATVVTGLDGLTTKPDGFVDTSVVGTDGYVALDHTLVEDDLDTDAKVTAVEEDRYIPLLNEDVNDPDSKITLGRLWKWVLGKIKSLSTTITAFRAGDVIPVDGPSGTAKMGKDDLLRVTAENAVAGKIIASFNPSKSNDPDGYAYHVKDVVVYDGKIYVFIANKATGAWDSTKVVQTTIEEMDERSLVSAVITDFSCVQGTLTNNGLKSSSNYSYRVRTGWISGDGNKYTIHSSSAGIVCLGAMIAKNGMAVTWARPFDWNASFDGVVVKLEKDYQYAFVFAKDDGTGSPDSVDISPSDVSFSLELVTPVTLEEIDTNHYVTDENEAIELVQGTWNNSGATTSTQRLRSNLITGTGQTLTLSLDNDFVCICWKSPNADGSGGIWGSPFNWAVLNKNVVTLDSGYYYSFVVAKNDGTGQPSSATIVPTDCTLYKMVQEALITKLSDEIDSLQEEIYGKVCSDSSQEANYRLTKLGVKDYASGITGGVSGFIPVKKGDIVRFSLYSGSSYSVLCSYDSSKNFIENICDGISVYTASEGSYLVDDDSVKYLRFYSFYPLSQQGSFKIESIPNYDDIGLRTGVVQVCIGGSVTYLSTDYCLKAWKNDGNVKQIITATNGAGLLKNNLFKNQWASVSDKASVTEIVIWISTNDWGSGQTLGNKEDYTYIDNYDVSKTGTICGAFNELISLIRSDNASAKIKVLLPVPAFWGDVSKGDRGYNKFSTGTNPLYAMANAIKECCEIQLIPYLEQWNLIQCDPNTWQNKYENDGVHPNANGYAMLTPSQIDFLRNT